MTSQELFKIFVRVCSVSLSTTTPSLLHYSFESVYFWHRCTKCHVIPIVWGLKVGTVYFGMKLVIILLTVLEETV